jgi:hypothetical protein
VFNTRRNTAIAASCAFLDFDAIVEALDERLLAIDLHWMIHVHILERNERIFFHGVANQAFPVNRQIGGRWFDETGWRAEVLELAMAEAANASEAVA